MEKTALEYYQEAEAADELSDAFSALVKSFHADCTYHPSYQLAAQLLRSVGAHEEAVLFEQVVANFQDGAPFFELGYHFVEVHNWTLAKTFLARAYQLAPKNAAVIYEYALVLMANFEYEKAKNIMKTTNITEDVWLAYRYFGCCVMLGEEVAEAKKFLREIREQIYNQANRSEDDGYVLQKLDELQEKIARSEEISFPINSLADSYYVQYGALLLCENEEEGNVGKRFYQVIMGYQTLKKILENLVEVLKINAVSPKIILYCDNRNSQIIAQALALFLNIKAESLSLENLDNQHSLIVGAEATDFSDFGEKLQTIHPQQNLFTFSLNWQYEPFLATEFVGVVAYQAVFPWNELLLPDMEQEADERDSQLIAKEIFETNNSEVHSTFDANKYKKGLILSKQKGQRPLFYRESPF